MIHAKYVKPRWFPHNNDRDPEQIDRLQEISGDLTLNREKLFEIGRVNHLGYRRQTSTLAFTTRQLECGSMAFWRALANKEDPASDGLDNSVDLDDLKTPMGEFAAFETDDSDTFVGTIWIPKVRVGGFSINIADPDSIIERSFDLVSENCKELIGKYFSFEKKTVSTPGDETVDLDPVPIEWASGKYIFKVLRVRGGAVSDLVEDDSSPYGDNTWRYSAGDVIVQDCLAGDIIKVYYPSDTAYTTTWTDNDVDPDALEASFCEIYMKVGTSERLYRLQSLGIDVTFDRADYKELGNSEIVQTGVTEKAVTVTLNKYAEDLTLETILAGDTTYPLIDPDNFSENIQIIVKVYGEKEHTNFKIGYLITGLTPSTYGFTQAVNEYQNKTTALISDNLKISDDESEIVFA